MIHVFATENGVNGLAIAKKAYYNANGKHVSSQMIFGYLRTDVSRYSATNKDELIAEIVVRNKNNPTDFTKAYVLLLKGET